LWNLDIPLCRKSRNLGEKRENQKILENQKISKLCWVRLLPVGWNFCSVPSHCWHHRLSSLILGDKVSIKAKWLLASVSEILKMAT